VGRAASVVTAWSHCSPGDDVADPGGVRGLFVATANQVSPAVLQDETKYLLPDKTLCGVDLVIPWSSVQLGPGEYDWTFIDKAAEPWEKAGKVVNLIVWGTDESARYELDKQGFLCSADPGQACLPATPAYVLGDLSALGETVDCGPKDGTELPEYWQPDYETPWRAFERALVVDVDDDHSLSRVGYIRFGLGTGGEDFPVDHYDLPAKNPPAGSCPAAWQAHHLSASVWLSWSLAQVAYEATLPAHNPINIGINTFSSLFGTLSDPLQDQVAAAAAADGMGVGMEGMTSKQAQGETLGSNCTRDWCEPFDTLAGRVPLEMQTYTQSDPFGAPPTGPLQPMLADMVTKFHAQVLELKPQEWLVADDPSWTVSGKPTYAAYHAAYATALADAAAEVGGQNTFVKPTLPGKPIPPHCKGSTCM